MHVKLSCHHDSRLAKSRGRVLDSPSAIGWVLSNLMDVSVGHDGTPPSLWQNLIDSCLVEQAIALIIVFFVDVRAWAWQLASRKFICQFQVIMSLHELMRSISKRLLLHMVGVQCTKCTDGTIMFFFVCFVPCVRVWFWLFFKVFFTRKSIKKIFFLFLKNYFWHQRIKIIEKHQKNINLK
jgi:hypothetical protein